MADEPIKLTRPEQFDPVERLPEFSVTFSGEFLDRVDTLVNHLAGITKSGSNKDQARAEAVGTAIATLSKYVGKPLWVEIDGDLQVIVDLWKSP